MAILQKSKYFLRNLVIKQKKLQRYRLKEVRSKISILLETTGGI